MSRLYLYGVTRGLRVPPRLEREGVSLIARGGAAAVVSELGDGPVEATRRNLLAHADVVETLHEEALVLPARFGTVLESRSAVEELLALPEIAELLERHAGSSELTLKGTYDEAVLGELAAGLGPLRDAYRRAPGLDTGVALGEAVLEELAERRAADTARVLDALAPLVLDVRASEPSGQLDAFRLALLVARSGVEAASAALDALASELSPPLRFELVGPLPPYSFADLAVPAVA